MKHILPLLILLGILFVSCKEDKKVEVETPSTNVHALKGIVVEKMNASNYTYMLLKNNDKEIWIAGPSTNVNEGETIYYSEGMEMKNFESKSLGKTFESIFFVDKVSKEPILANGTSPHAMRMGKDVDTRKTVKKYEAVKIAHSGDTKTIAYVFENMKSLQGQEIKLKGKVTKYNTGILDRNWIHIQDGTDFNGDFDLLVTSQEPAKVGDIITVVGKIAVDIDFGAGYSYKVLVEKAKIVNNEM